MMEFLFTILIFFGVIALAAVVFGGWMLVWMARGIYRTLFGHRLVSQARASHSMRIHRREPSSLRCDRPLCRAENPAGARFCRRCGRSLPDAGRLSVQRVAMW